MGEGNSLINLGELSKPATVLIEKISDAIGVVYETRKIEQLAKAEVEADKIRALGRIELSSLEQRAMHRLVAEETKKQENIENIIAKAVKGLKDDAKPENLERDWVANFFDKCRLVSDEEMQSLWSRLLTGEANEPGTFSKRTVELVASLDKKDAHLFTRLISFALNFKETCPIIYDPNNKIYTSQGINFKTLSDLESIGLIKFNPVEGFALLDVTKPRNAKYFGIDISVDPPDKQIQLGKALLTKTGEELAPICGASSQPDFLEYVYKEWDKRGYTYSCE